MFLRIAATNVVQNVPEDRSNSTVLRCGAHKDVCESVSHDQTLGLMMKRRRIHHSKICEITTCIAANIVLCKNSDNIKKTIAACILLHILVESRYRAPLNSVL